MGRQVSPGRSGRITGTGVLVTVLALWAPPAAAQSSGVPPHPVCRPTTTGPVSGSPHPGDGMPDPDGRIAYAVVGRFDPQFGPIGTRLYAIDPDGSDQVLLLDCDLARPQWSPDGTRLAVTILLDDGSWQVATVAPDGSDLRVLTSGPGIHEIPTWSADGTWLGYDGADVGLDDPTFRTTIRRVGADGSGAALLGDPDTFDVEPRLSLEGDQLAFERLHPEADWATDIVIRDLASGAERTVLRSVAVEHPEWSPDGHSLIFNAQDGTPDAATIYTLDVDRPGAKPVVLLGPGSGWGGVKPVYSPDGSRIVFVCHPTSGSQQEGSAS